MRGINDCFCVIWLSNGSKNFSMFMSSCLKEARKDKWAYFWRDGEKIGHLVDHTCRNGRKKCRWEGIIDNYKK